MEFRISDTFTASLARLTGDEQKAVKTTAFDLQMDPSHPGMQFHRLDRARDRNFWSVRVNRDIRLILHRTDASLLLCYVAHHDDAYKWAERRKLETHPTTGAAQLVEIQETTREIIVPRYVDGDLAPPPQSATPLFPDHDDGELLGYGVPADWLSEVRAATEDTFFEVAARLPAEAAEALLQLATGGTPSVTRWTGPEADPFEHPDAKRRFRTVADAEELAAALEYPWEKWTVFLHPAQRDSVERTYNGPARISGSAGTGKTIVALHRAVHLARKNMDARILLTTFSDPLANALRSRLHILVTGQPRLAERIDVSALDALARRLHRLNLGEIAIATPTQIRDLLDEARSRIGDAKASLAFLVAEWSAVVDAWQLDSWEAYRDVARLGRRTRLPESRREQLWQIFDEVRSQLSDQGMVTTAGMYRRLTEHYSAGAARPFEYVIVDEAQDLSIAQLRFLAALVEPAPDALLFTGDLGQRIFQAPFSWRSLGVDIVGRSRTLRVNYRTSQQIRRRADLLLAPEITDVDGVSEDRRGTVSAFEGPDPEVRVLPSIPAEAEAVSAWLAARTGEGIAPEQLAIFVRSAGEVERARQAAGDADLPCIVLDEHVETRDEHIAIATMHLAKGLEFRGVVVMACDDGVLPLDERIAEVGDQGDLAEVYDTERHLLYVACTRARDRLLITGVEPASEFLDDLAPERTRAAVGTGPAPRE